MKNRLSVCWVLLSLVLMSTANAQNSAQSALYQLFDDEIAYQQTLSPQAKKRAGEPTKGGFADLSLQSLQQQQVQFKTFMRRLKAIPLSELNQQDTINHQLFEYRLQSILDYFQYERYLFPKNGDTGFYFELLRLPESTIISSADDASFYRETLAAIPKYLQQWTELMKQAIDAEKVYPAVVLIDFEKPLDALVTPKIDQHPLLKPLESLDNHMPVQDAQILRQQVKQLLENSVIPAIGKMQQFLAKEYIPAGRKSIATTDLPSGDAFYQSQVSYYTTLPLSADQVHQIGLKEVARIRDEMQQVILDSGFDGSFVEYIEYLRSDPRFYAKTPDQLLKEAAYIAKKMDGLLPRYFKRLPRQPYGVEPVPASIAPRYTTGRYVGAPLNSQRAGNYWVNTYALDKRPLYVLEALTLHEAVPGHHLQSALTKELEGLPEFRRQSYISAYGEGWALYCEKLGVEAGFYQTPETQFGRLTYEMWRAIRLVVDTGMHAKGWSRQRAIDFMLNNTALSELNVITEIDRYISWPGQALSYKMGEIKIIELRQRAEKRLGLKFDIRDFHDQLLQYGPVTLPILEQQLNQWIEQQASR